jgi:hypothetical protein
MNQAQRLFYAFIVMNQHYCVCIITATVYKIVLKLQANARFVLCPSNHWVQQLLNNFNLSVSLYKIICVLALANYKIYSYQMII